MSWLYRCQQRIFNEQTNYFQILYATFRHLYCVKFPLQTVDISRSYARKQQWVFACEHSVQQWTVLLPKLQTCKLTDQKQNLNAKAAIRSMLISLQIEIITLLCL